MANVLFVENRKKKHTGQNIKNPRAWVKVLKTKNKGVVLSIYENSCGEEATSIDGRNRPVIIHNNAQERMKKRNNFFTE
jgi:hypothetical protein